MYVCDTHALIFYMADELPKTLDPIFTSVENRQAVMYIPSIAIAEALHLKERGKVDFNIKELFDKLNASINYFIIVPLDEHILKLMPELKKVPEIHDRIITATALLYKSALLTKDSEIVKSGYVKTVW